VGKKEPWYTAGGASTLEENLEACLKSKYRSATGARNPTPGDIPKGMQHRLLQRHCTPIFIAALFTIAKLWK
jgi:hypothetical protein